MAYRYSLNIKKEKKNMQKNKQKILALLFAAIFAASTICVLIPTTNAHDPPWSLPTYSFINIAPAPIGVGQTVNVNFWLNVPPPTASGAYGDRWQNMYVIVTHPDGTEETLGPFSSDDTGGSFTTYTPSTTGEYTFQMSFPGETLEGTNLQRPNAYVGDYYEPSESNVFHLTVQEEPIGIRTSNPTANRVLDTTHLRPKQRLMVCNRRCLAWPWSFNICKHRPIQPSRRLRTLHYRAKQRTHNVDQTNRLWRCYGRRIW